jgi:trimethylamine--corrinoid protein Co-methyltransferase
MFATGMTFSHEQLIMDDEMSAVSQRIKSGIKVNQETIAKDLIKEIGPQSETYLTTDHTLNWLRSDEYIKPQISVSGPFASWQAKGAKGGSPKRCWMDKG